MLSVSRAYLRRWGKTYVAYGAQHQAVEDSGKLAQTPPETPAVCHASPLAHGQGRSEKKTILLTTAAHIAVIGHTGRHVGYHRAGHLAHGRTKDGDQETRESGGGGTMIYINQLDG